MPHRRLATGQFVFVSVFGHVGPLGANETNADDPCVLLTNDSSYPFLVARFSSFCSRFRCEPSTRARQKTGHDEKENTVAREGIPEGLNVAKIYRGVSAREAKSAYSSAFDDP